MSEEVKDTTQSESPKKKNNALTIIIIVVVILVVLGVGGTFVARWVAQKAADKIAGGLLGAATNSNVSVNSDTGSVSVSNEDGTMEIGSAKWPETMPADVPEYTSGKISVSSSTANDVKGWTVIISETNENDFNLYKSAVVSKGWAVDTTTSFGAEVTFYKKDNYNLSLTWDPSSNGVSIVVTPVSE